MKETPILFNGEMVRAILEGRKTQTRRPFKYQPTDCWRPDRFCVLHELKDGHFPLRNGEPIPIGYGVVNEDGDVGYVSPFGNVGDHLWVRENFRYGTRDNGQSVIVYAADGEVRELFASEGGEGDLCKTGRIINERVGTGPCRPSIHMPRWASRITLKVTDIRVQRVQEISEEDAIAEGCSGSFSPAYCAGGEIVGADGEYPSDEFRKLWDSIYGTWDANPWVWVATFEVAK